MKQVLIARSFQPYIGGPFSCCRCSRISKADNRRRVLSPPPLSRHSRLYIFQRRAPCHVRGGVRGHRTGKIAAPLTVASLCPPDITPPWTWYIRSLASVFLSDPGGYFLRGMVAVDTAATVLAAPLQASEKKSPCGPQGRVS